MRKSSPWWAEFVCYFWGHHWISSWRRVRDDYPPGWTRNKSSNPFCEYVSSWRYKCRRCRVRTRNDAWHPIWREVWWATKNFVSAWWIVIDLYRPKKGPRETECGYSTTDIIGFTAAILYAPVFGAIQGYAQFCDRRWFMGWPFSVLAWLEDRLHPIIDRHTTNYDWFPPDGEKHGVLTPAGYEEVGFHSHWEFDRDPLTRTRHYRLLPCEPTYQGAGPWTGSTNHSGLMVVFHWPPSA